MANFIEQLDSLLNNFKKVGLGPVPKISTPPSPYLTSNPNDAAGAIGPNMKVEPKKKVAPFEIKIGENLIPEQAKIAEDVFRKPSSLPPEPLSFREAREIEKTSLQDQINKKLKSKNQIDPKYLPSEELKKEAFNTVYFNPIFGATSGLEKVGSTIMGKASPQLLEYLAKTKDASVIESELIKLGVNPDAASHYSPKLAATNSVDEVKNVLLNNTSIVPKNPTPGETPAEALARSEAYAKAQHPTTTAPTDVVAPKVQISEEGIPMARKPSVPYLPKVAAKVAPRVIQPPTPTGTFGLLKRELSPLKYIDPETSDTFRQWNANTIKAKELANQTSSSIKIPNDGMDLINRYQSGESMPQVKQIFDELFNEANRRGVEVPYRQNYIPQVYQGTYQDTQKAIAKYLTDHGITDEQATDYIKGINPLPEEVAARLKVSPTFEKARVFPNYKVAEEYGLKPKYKTVAELAAHYRGELEKVSANNNLIDTLKKKGLIKPADSEFTPRDWVRVSNEFTGMKSYRADPNIAKVINNIFPEASQHGLYSKVVHKVGEVSGMIQNITLSGGLPRTNVNFFALGQLNKELHSGNTKAVASFLRSNSGSLTVKYFNKHKQALLDMAEQNIDVTLRTGSFGQEKIMDLIKDREFTKALGLSIDKAFGAKTFQGFMPMMQVQIFEDVYKSALKKGVGAEEAKKLAGDIVKKNFGINSDDFARSQTTRDTLKAGLFAPRFRESIINSVGNTGKAGLDLAYHLGGARGRIDPSLSRNRRLLTGMILSFAAYNIINKKISGNYMWENPDNRKFALRIPRANGEVIYVEFMPSYLSFARNMAESGLALGKGNFETATQKFGSVFSMPIKLTSEVVSNKDYFGNPIYKETDDGKVKALKIAQYIGLGVNHPYVKELMNQIEDKKPLYQSIVTALELPLKFSSKNKEEANKIFNIMDQQNKDRADKTNDAQKEYERLKALPKDQANAQIKEIYETDPDKYEKIKNILEAEKMGLTDNERYVKMLGTEYRAKYIFDKLSEMSTKEEKNSYIQDLARKKIITKDVNEELAKLINNK